MPTIILRSACLSTQVQLCDLNVFEGLTCHGAPEFVLSGGRVAVYEYRLNSGLEGSARRLECSAFPETLYDAVRQTKKDDEGHAVDRGNAEKGEINYYSLS